MSFIKIVKHLGHLMGRHCSNKFYLSFKLYFPGFIAVFSLFRNMASVISCGNALYLHEYLRVYTDIVSRRYAICNLWFFFSSSFRQRRLSHEFLFSKKKNYLLILLPFNLLLSRSPEIRLLENIAIAIAFPSPIYSKAGVRIMLICCDMKVTLRIIPRL